jgi:WD40 repeat protein
LALVFLSSLTPVLADNAIRPRATWEERDGRVVLFSPDGRALVSSGRDGSRLRDAETGRVRAELTSPPTIPLRIPAFTPDSRLLFAQVISDRSLPLVVHDITAWDVSSGQPSGSFPYVAEHLDDGSFALSGDGRRLAFVDNSERLPLDVKTSTVGIFSPSLQHINISWNANPGLPRVKIWDVPGWKEIAVVDGGLPLAISRDAETLVTCDRKWSTPVARVWDAATGRLRKELQGRAPGPFLLSLSPDGKYLTSSSFPSYSFWTMDDGQKWPLDAKGSSGERPAFSADAKLLFLAGLPRMERGVSHRFHPCFDVTEKPPRPFDLGDGEVIVSPDARRYAAVSTATGPRIRSVVIHGLPGQQEIRRFDVWGLVHANFSPDGRHLALLVYRRVADPGTGSTQFALGLRVLVTDTGREDLAINFPTPIVPDPGWRFSPDGKALAVWYNRGDSVVVDNKRPSDRPQTVEIWDLPVP